MTQVLRFPIHPLQPGGYSALDIAGLAQSGQNSGQPIVAILGDCRGGAPNTPLPFTNPQTLRSILRSGPAYDTARVNALAAAGRGGQQIVVRVGANITRASKALAGATGIPVTLFSLDYGAWNNGIKATISANNKVALSYTDALGNTYNESWALGSSATAQDVVDAINGSKAGFSRSAYVGAAVTTGTMPLTTAAQSNLTGGADAGSLSSGDWTTALAALESVEVDVIVAATGDATVHAQVKAHCDVMSGVQARKERTQISGGVLGETGTQAGARAAALAASRTQLVWPGAYVLDDGGNAVLYDPYVVAAGIAGEHCALPDQATSLVHQTLPWIVDTEKALSTAPGGELDTALANGVTPINRADGGGIWVVDSLSTNLSVPLLADFHKIRTADAVSKYARRRLEKRFVGGKGLNGTAQSIFREALAILDFLTRSELIRGYQDPTVESDPNDPRAYLIALPVILPDTTKYVLITVALLPPAVTSATAA